jgi:putative DNA primase/helicase
MIKNNLSTSEIKRNGNSMTATSSSGNHADKTRPTSHAGVNALNCRPIGALELGAKTSLPKINIEVTDLSVITPCALKHLTAANKPPYLFRYGGSLAWLELGDEATPFVQHLTESHLRHELARTMRWGVIRNKKWAPKLPPIAIVRDMFATPNSPFPVLESVVQTPVFGLDGSIQLTAGYHPASRSFYLPRPGFSVPTIPEPSAEEVARAKSLLVEELLGDFPFVSDADRAHAIAFSLLFYLRNLIEGPTPLHLFEKPSPGTGATLLVDVLTWPAIGRPLPAMSEGGDDEEFRKRITAKLRNGPAAILIDNVRKPLDSGALAAALTSTVWEDRILRQSQILRLPVRCAWAATGNNPALSNEITRRTVRIRMDAKVEKPWLGRQFRHPDLPGWVKARRSDLVWAHLVLGRAWIAAGQPPGGKKLGMFESWSEVIGGILEVAGIPGFLGNLAELYEESDAESDAFHEFVDDWLSELKNQSVGVDDLLETAQRHLDLGGGAAQGQKIRLGKLLARNRDRQFGTLRLERVAKYRGSWQWRLVSTQG